MFDLRFLILVLRNLVFLEKSILPAVRRMYKRQLNLIFEVAKSFQEVSKKVLPPFATFYNF